MKMKITNAFLLLGCLAIMLSSCKRSKYKGFDKTDSGIYYKFQVKKDGARKPKLKEMLTINLSIKIGDSIWIDSKKAKSEFIIPFSKSEYKGDINECFSLLGVGDSASFKINADSLIIKTFRMKTVPKNVKPGSDASIEIKLVKIQTMEELQNAFRAKMETMMKEEDARIAAYVEQNKITAKPAASGLYYIEIKAGNGAKPSKDKKVKVNYTGTLLDGTKFSSTDDMHRPYEFVFGQNQSIPGFEEGIGMMKVGGKAKFIIPSKLAYGERDNGTIPPFSTLVFEVELLDMK